MKAKIHDAAFALLAKCPEGSLSAKLPDGREIKATIGPYTVGELIMSDSHTLAVSVIDYLTNGRLSPEGPVECLEFEMLLEDRKAAKGRHQSSSVWSLKVVWRGQDAAPVQESPLSVCDSFVLFYIWQVLEALRSASPEPAVAK